MCISFHKANPSNSPDRPVSRTSVDLLIAAAPSLKALVFPNAARADVQSDTTTSQTSLKGLRSPSSESFIFIGLKFNMSL